METSAIMKAALDRRGISTPPGQVGAVAEQPNFPNTDLGNAERLVWRHGQDLRFCHTWDSWLVWDGVRWKTDENGEIYRRCAETTRSLYAEASQIVDREIRDAMVKFARGSESRRALKAMEELARNLEGVPVTVDQLDTHASLLNFPNGTYDVNQGALRTPDRKDLITKMVAVAYDPTAEAPTWDRFCYEIMLERNNLLDYLQRAVGYSITAYVTEKVLFLCHGGGNNGKTTFLETMKTALGEYAGQILVDHLMVQHNQNSAAASPDVAKLFGLRFVTSSESEEGQRLAESRVKYLTGGNRVMARRLYENGWDFPPTWKIWMDLNHLPNVRGNDKAIWNRLRRIPFELELSDADVDMQLGEKLVQELPGILRWAVDGCLAYRKEGLGSPLEVVQATGRYHDLMDVLGKFLEESTDQDTYGEVPARHLYRTYHAWASSSGEYPISERMFAERLEERGIRKRHTRTGNVYIGLRIASEDHYSPENLPFEPVKGEGL